MELTGKKRDLEEAEALEEPLEHPFAFAHEVFNLAWPAMAMNALQVLNAFIDRKFVGSYLGKDALAAVGVSGQLMFLMISTAFALSTGTTALVARSVGAKETAQARKTVRQSFLLAVLLGLLITSVAFFLVNPYIRSMNLEGETAKDAADFLNITLLGIAPMFVLNILAGAFRGLGDTLRPMKIMVVVNLAHIAGNFLLIPGYGGLPQFGVRGAAFALTASQYLGMFLYVSVFARRGIPRALGIEKLEMEWVKRILRISIPASFQAIMRITSMMGFTWVLGRTAEKTAALAALNIGINAEAIAFMPGLGYMVAASSLVGRSLGAQDPQRAEKLGWAAAWQCCALMSVMGIAFFVGAYPLSRWFIDDPEVLKLSVDYLRIMALSEPLLAFAMTLAGALQGAGDTVRPTILTFISMWLVRVPLTFVMAITLAGGAHSAWWAMMISQSLSGILMILVFKSGHWKQTRV